MVVRSEAAGDFESIRTVHLLAFGRPDEADLVDRLRDRAASVLSLVAVEGDQVIGHVLFSPVRIETVDTTFDGLGLAPVAVLPAHQNKGAGSLLIREAIGLLRDAGHAVVTVLGHPGYYPRFGFVPANRYGISCEYDVPDEAFMILELFPNALAGRGGKVKYRPEFHEV